MYSLFIDTHSSLITVALLNDKELIKKEKESINSHSIYLLNMVKDILSENDLNMSNLKEILVVNGPGSFTGIRIGLSVAKTLSYALKIPIKTISSLTCYLVSSQSDKKLAAIKENKGYFISAVDKDNNVLIEEQFVNELNYDDYNIVNNTFNLRNIYNYFKTIKEENVHNVKANYVKKIEAEKWLKKLKKELIIT